MEVLSKSRAVCFSPWLSLLGFPGVSFPGRNRGAPTGSGDPAQPGAVLRLGWHSWHRDVLPGMGTGRDPAPSSPACPGLTGTTRGQHRPQEEPNSDGDQNTDTPRPRKAQTQKLSLKIESFWKHVGFDASSEAGRQQEAARARFQRRALPGTAGIAGIAGHGSASVPEDATSLVWPG